MSARAESRTAEKVLAGRRIVVTRAAGDAAQSFARALRAMGARVIEFPVIEIAPPDDFAPLDRAIARLDSFDWLIFTSPNGVDAFFERLKALSLHSDAMRRARLGAIGPATAARLEARGLKADAVPGEYRAEAIVGAIGAARIRGARFLIPRAKVAREELPRMLAEAGAAEVSVVPAYQTRPRRGSFSESLRRRIEAADLLTFTSSSTVESFCALLGSPAPRRHAAVIGPITAESARRRGFEVVAMPEHYTIPALAEAIRKWAMRSG
jgi:uroporphyrinogen III methyltransferase/synthase